MYVEIEQSFPDFFNSTHYTKQNDNMKEETKVLINAFINKGFNVWPEWRHKHSTSKNLVWTLKTENKVKKSGFDNVVTIYPLANQLKVEVYYGEYNKLFFYFSRNSENHDLFIKSRENYQNKLGKSL